MASVEINNPHVSFNSSCPMRPHL